MAGVGDDDGKAGVSHGRLRERQSTFPMIPVDEAVGQVLKEASPLSAVTMKLSDVPPGTAPTEIPCRQ